MSHIEYGSDEREVPRIPYVNLKDSINHLNHKEYSERIKPTLGELLKWVYKDDSPPHHAVEIAEAASKPRIPYPLVLSFHSLTYSVKVGRKANGVEGYKVLLDDISGEAREGEITAVLGASGSGKSTLIDALADRISKESIQGSVLLNDEVLESKLQKVISAYVMQDDLLFPMLTVEETLMFSAEFRLPRAVSKSKKKGRVEALIDQLGLRGAAHTVIGDEAHRGVSGGERRRVSIGIDIIHDPILLLLDEPTSGLDSTSAFMVVKVLQRIAQSGSIVVMTIHQPSSRILNLLDRLILLSRGQTVFTGTSSDLPLFFSEFGCPIPQGENKTEFALDHVQQLEDSPDGTQAMVHFNKSWQHQRMNTNTSSTTTNNNNYYYTPSHRPPKLSLKGAISASISKGKLVSGGASDESNPTSVPKYANPFWVEVYVIGRRSMLNSRRMPELFGIRLGAIVVTGAILATIFMHLDQSPKGAQERLGFFAFAMSTTFYTCAEAIPVFLQERYIFMRETSYNAYRRSSYVLSHALISIPSLIVLSLTFAAITFWSVGLAGGFMYYFAFILASFWAGHSFVTFLSGVVTHVMLGFTVVVAILAYFLLFSGFFISRDRIPTYWLWFHYISLVKYPYQGVLLNEFNDPTKCFVRGIQMFDNTPLQAVPDILKTSLLKSMGQVLGRNLTSTSCVTTGHDILQQQGITDFSMLSCLFITIAWGFFFRFLFYVALMFGSKGKRS